MDFMQTRSGHALNAFAFGNFVGILVRLLFAEDFMNEPVESRANNQKQQQEQQLNAISKFLMCEISNLRFTIFLC